MNGDKYRKNAEFMENIDGRADWKSVKKQKRKWLRRNPYFTEFAIDERRGNGFNFGS